MIASYHSLVQRLNNLPAPDLNLFARVWIALIFFKSGLLKWGDSWFSASDSTLYLFENEYALPLLSPEFAASMAIYMEFFLPLLLLFGFLSRFSALGLLGMTAVIQLFVYPGSWSEHLTWAVVLVFLVLRGGGNISVDRVTIEKKVD